jgi:signal transduction histidine kinase
MALVLSARPLPAGGLILVMQDLTEIRRLEAMRRDFVANVSHELKTPLTSISGYSETLLADHPDPDTTQRFLQVILGNAQRMQRLVDSLLDLSRIESGRWQPKVEVVDLRPIILGVFEDSHERSVGNKVQLEMDLAPDATVLAADEDAVRQIVLNLVDNALRYTPAGGTALHAVSMLYHEATKEQVPDSPHRTGRPNHPHQFTQVLHRVHSTVLS